MNKARAMIPPISNTQKLLMIVEIMFIALRLSLFLMQVIESINPVKTETIFTPAHTERTPSVNVIWNKSPVFPATPDNCCRGLRSAFLSSLWES